MRRTRFHGGGVTSYSPRFQQLTRVFKNLIQMLFAEQPLLFSKDGRSTLFDNLFVSPQLSIQHTLSASFHFFLTS